MGEGIYEDVDVPTGVGAAGLAVRSARLMRGAWLRCFDTRLAEVLLRLKWSSAPGAVSQDGLVAGSRSRAPQCRRECQAGN